jgi:hypothetical protein
VKTVDPAAVAVVDQLEAGLMRCMAPALARYTESLMTQGYSREEAVLLTRDFQLWLLRP